MTLHLQVPCEGPELTDVIILNNGEMEFPDYDIEHDLVLAEMGEEPTFCSVIYLKWERDPLNFICKSGLFPINLVGRIMTSWCKESIRLTKDELTEMGCYKALVANAKACASFWTSKKPSIKRIYQTRIDVVNCWNKYARDGYPKHFGLKETKNKVVDSSIENTLCILDIVNQTGITGGVYEQPTKRCTVLKRNIRDVLYVKLSKPQFDAFGLVLSIDEDLERVDERMFELAMKEIKRYGG